MARLPEGTLMRRAAFGLAVHARRMLADPGPVAGARVRCWWGRGTTAATRCGRVRSCGVAASA